MSRFRPIAYLTPPISFVAILAVMNWTDPTKDIASILLVFLLVYIFFASMLYLLLHFVARAGSLFRQRFPTNSQPPIRPRRAYYISSALAFVPVALLAMQSLNQVRLLDIVLVVFLAILAIFYIIKRT